MGYQRLFCRLGISAIAILISGSPTLSQESDSKPEETEEPRPPFEVRLVPPAPSASGGGSCFNGLKDPATFEKELRESNSELPQDQQLSEKEIIEQVKNKQPLQSERVELYYYRNAEHMVSLLSQLPLGEGCATILPLNELRAGRGVGRGGGNIVSLYGTETYINNAQRFITSLDLPLPGIDLQLWGVQISSDNPDKLAKTTSKVRSRISTTQGLLRRTFAAIQGLSQLVLQNKVDTDFQTIANRLGYADALDGFGGESSILEIFLVGDSLPKEERIKFYQNLYNRNFRLDTKANGNDVNNNQVSNPLQPYIEKMRNDTGRLPFERIFRSRGLKPVPDCENKEKLQKDDENNQLKCEKWRWEEDFVEDLDGGKVSLVDITTNFERKVLLEFALNYTDFLENPQDFDPEELQRTANNLNELLQEGSDLLQKDIEDLFLKPTLAMIQQEVGENKGVEFAQVGRSNISTLDGVETQINTSSTSGFQIPQSQDLGQLLERAQKLQKLIGDFIPTETLPGASEASEIVTAGPLPSSQVIALAVAALEQNAIPAEIQTGTNLTFTPGIARNLNSAELNINLTVVDPTVTPTAEEKNVPPISRIGKQEMQTTVYTQALDFFDLSTFTSQATLDGGRFRIPIIGNLWNAIFGAIPVFGDLFSVSKGNQNVLHDSLILTNSFITPTPLSLGNLYSPNNGDGEFDFCTERENLLDYLNGSNDPNDPNFMKPKIGGQASRRDTKIISNRENCLPKK